MGSDCYHYTVSTFFFSSRRRHTRLQGDWSSDVCSSDLRPPWRATGARSEGRATVGGKGGAGRDRVIALSGRGGGPCRGSAPARIGLGGPGSEERRGGEECRSRGAADP